MIKVTEDSIIIDRKALFAWVTGEDHRVKNEDIPEPDPAPPTQSSDEAAQGGLDPVQGVDLFEEKQGIGGFLQDANGGKDKLAEMRSWFKANKFNYKNFCKYLLDLKEIAGWKLSKPLIGTTQKGEPSLLYVATRYYSFWKSQQNLVAKEYKDYVLAQLNNLGYTVASALEIFEGSEEIDPASLPKGTEVDVS